MGLVDRADAFERRDLGALDGLHGRDARADRLPFHDHRAGSALPEPAAKLRPVQCQIVAQHIQKRRRRIDVHRVNLAIYL